MKNILRAFVFILFSIPVCTLACTNRNGESATISFAKDSVIKNAEVIDDVQLKITTAGRSYLASFTDTRTAREFIQLLPLTFTMGDLNGREKYSSLSKELYKESNVQTSFSAGDISYWLGGGIAIFYNADGHQVKDGLIVIAHLDKGVTEFSQPGSIEITFEVVKK